MKINLILLLIQRIAYRVSVAEKNNQLLVGDTKSLQTQLHIAALKIARMHEQGRQSLDLKVKRGKGLAARMMRKPDA